MLINFIFELNGKVLPPSDIQSRSHWVYEIFTGCRGIQWV